MRLLENLRNVEQKGVRIMREGMARAREEWGDVERRLRQRMRIYPQKLKQRVLATAPSQTNPAPHLPTQQPAAETETPKPIISVHGRDIEDDDLDHPAA